MAAARLILDLLLGHPDLPALSEAILSHQLHDTFIRIAVRAVPGPSMEQGLREVSLQVLHILASQPVLHGRLLASGICGLLSNVLRSFLSSFPEDGSPDAVVATLGHLCLAGAPCPCLSLSKADSGEHSNVWLQVLHLEQAKMS